MNKKNIIVNIFSNWINFLVTILIAFFVSPIIVHSLGNDNYGIWILIVSITGYFTVLDFGINTAIVRFISMYTAQKNEQKANEIYCTSFAFFFVISFITILGTALFAFFFKDIFNIESLSKSYLYFVFFVVGTDLAFSLLFSVFLGTLTAMQQFTKINVISIASTLIKNVILVMFLISGYKLLTLAIIQLISTVLRYLAQYIIIRKEFSFFSFQLTHCRRDTFKKIYNYSIYSFIISIALKILFYTDSVVIGSLITVNEVTFYAIPATLIDYMEKFIWAIVAVLIPIISSQDAVSENKKNNESLYILGTKYTYMLSLPIIFVLFTVGDDFISMWMGKEYGIRCMWVLKILLIGYTVSLSQLIAQGILKGISKHKMLAYMLIIAAVANLSLSVVLSKRFGIEGVAIGTMLPLIIVNGIFIPLYTCRELNMKYVYYLRNSYLKPSVMLLILSIFYYMWPVTVFNYIQLALYAIIVILFTALFFWFFIIDKTHKVWFTKALLQRIS